MSVKPNAERETRSAERTVTLLFRVPTSAFRVLPVRNTKDLLDGGQPRLHLPPAVLPQRHHALSLAERPEGPGVRDRFCGRAAAPARPRAWPRRGRVRPPSRRAA